MSLIRATCRTGRARGIVRLVALKCPAPVMGPAPQPILPRSTPRPARPRPDLPTQTMTHPSRPARRGNPLRPEARARPEATTVLATTVLATTVLAMTVR